MRARDIAITPSVLAWAIDQSGLSQAEVASRLKVSAATVSDWAEERGQPSLTQFRKLAETLRRAEALFFLPAPPKQDDLAVEFRRSPKETRTEPNASERKGLRDAKRLQRVLKWLLAEMRAQRVKGVGGRLDENPGSIAGRARTWLQVSVAEQTQWSSAAQALRGWVSALEDHGVFVFSYAMGRESCRGFSIWDETAPVIAINTAWNYEARIFTLFHEFGHLLTKTSSVCASVANEGSDDTERWCERFAAALLLPPAETRDALRAFGGVTGDLQAQLGTARKVARRFRVSVRAVVLRLIESGDATWDLYRSIPAISDAKAKGGQPTEEPRDRFVVRRQQYGERASSLVAAGLRADLMSQTDVLGLLDIRSEDLPRLSQTA